MRRCLLIVVAVYFGCCCAQNPMLREVVVPTGSLNQLGNWIQQVERASYLDCPTNENRFGLTCDPATTSRDDLDNYFCGSSPSDFGWCGAYWEAMVDGSLDGVGSEEKRGVSNGALPINTNSQDTYARYSMYLEMLGRVCSCHCGCSAGCSSSSSSSQASHLFCGSPLNQALELYVDIEFLRGEGHPLEHSCLNMATSKEQTFSTSNSGELYSIKIWFENSDCNQGNPEGDAVSVEVRVYEDNCEGQQVGGSVVLDYAYDSESGLFEFVFPADNRPLIQAGQTYMWGLTTLETIICPSIFGDSEMCLELSSNSDVNGYTSGYVDGAPYTRCDPTATPNRDFFFTTTMIG